MSYPKRAACLLATLFCLSGGLAGRPATAADDAAASAAREHYVKGTSFYDLGKYQDAIREFEAAYEAKNDPAFLYNLAQSHRLAGNPEQALHFYRTYVKRAPNVANRAEIDERIKKLEKLVEQKTATQNSPPNQTMPPAGGVPTRTPGPATEPAPPPAVSAPPAAPPPAAAPPTTTTVPPATAQPMPPPMPPAPLPPPPPAASSGASSLQLAGYVLGGAGVVSIVVGALYGKAAKSAADDLAKASSTANGNIPMFNATLQDIDQRGRHDQTMEFVFLGLGAAAVTGGIICYVTGTPAETPTPGRVSVLPTISARGGSALLQVTF